MEEEVQARFEEMAIFLDIERISHFERDTHFCPRLIFLCHLRQTLVGANMRPERHWLPKAA